MNSLQDLNNYASQTFEYEDNRPAGADFTTLLFVDESFNILQGQTQQVPIKTTVTDIVNYQTAEVFIEIDLTSYPDPFQITTQNQSTAISITESPDRFYRISGFQTPEDFNILEIFLDPPISYSGTFEVPVKIGDANNFGEFTVTVVVDDVQELSFPGEAEFFYETTTQVTNTPNLVPEAEDTTYTITGESLDYTESIAQFTTTANVSFFGYDNETKSFTAQGTKAQINDMFDNLFFTSSSNSEARFKFRYTATKPTGASDITDQTFVSIDNTWLTVPVSRSVDYVQDQSFELVDGPRYSETSDLGTPNPNGTLTLEPSDVDAIDLIQTDTTTSYSTISNNYELFSLTYGSTAFENQFTVRNQITASSDASLFAIGTSDYSTDTKDSVGRVWVYSYDSFTQDFVFEQELAPQDVEFGFIGLDVSMSSDGSKLLVAGNRDFYIYDTSTWQIEYSFQGSSLNWAKLAKNGTRFFQYDSLEDELAVYDKINNSWTLVHSQTISHSVDGIFCNSAGDRIFIARFLNLYVYTFDGFQFSLEQTINSETTDNVVRHCAVTPSGDYIAVSQPHEGFTGTNYYQVWKRDNNANTYSKIHEITSVDNQSDRQSVSFTDDESKVLLGDQLYSIADTTVSSLDSFTYQPVGTEDEQTSPTFILPTGTSVILTGAETGAGGAKAYFQAYGVSFTVSFDIATKQLTIQGSPNQINTVLDGTVSVTPAQGYAETFQMFYRLQVGQEGSSNPQTAKYQDIQPL